MQNVDYLIVGQGIAGTVMAHLLLGEGKTVVVVDPGLPSSSSVAGGMFNPVTGRRFVKSWMIDTLLPVAEKVYRRMEEELGTAFYYNIPITRYISGEEEQGIYLKALNIENRTYISAFHPSENGRQFASCEIVKGGYVDTALLLKRFGAFLKYKDSLRTEVLEYNDLEINKDGITWKDIHAHNLVFCEGYKAVNNPFFPEMPFKLAKGEILTVKIPGLNAKNILISGGYLVPLGDDVYKLGSTYSWDDLSEDPTKKGLEELSGKLRKITDLPFEILAHEAGIRPAVKQRRPFLGRHPEHNHISILNGMGTKGVVLVPYFGEMLCRNLIYGEPISNDVDVQALMPTFQN